MVIIFLWLLPFLLHSFSFCMFVWRFSQLGFKVGKHRCSDHKAAFPRVKANHCINQHTWEFHSLSASRGLLKTDMLELSKLPLYNVQGILSITSSLLPTEMLENFRRQIFPMNFGDIFPPTALFLNLDCYKQPYKLDCQSPGIVHPHSAKYEWDFAEESTGWLPII